MADENFEPRVGGLERDVARLREQNAITAADAAAARVLAAGADHDVSEVRGELRAHTRVIHALRETQLEMREEQLEMRETLNEHTRILGEHTRVLGEHTRILGEHGRTLGEHGRRMDEGFSTLNVGMAQIVALLTTIIDADKG